MIQIRLSCFLYSLAERAYISLQLFIIHEALDGDRPAPSIPLSESGNRFLAVLLSGFESGIELTVSLSDGLGHFGHT